MKFNTHDVVNQPPVLENYNCFLRDQALQDAVHREGASWACADIERFGETAGSAETIALGYQANAHKPQLQTHDRFGHRLDEVEFHPAYHQLMQIAIAEGLHASPWQQPRAGAHVARAAKYYLHTQVEAAHGCPITMTFAVVPALKQQPDIAAKWLPRVLTNEYDSRNIPVTQKHGVTFGMGMTEKQGGSDVRANTTRAEPLTTSGSGELYELIGHKWFLSAPMCDAFLMLAQTTNGLSCFLVPRWRTDGTKNPLELVRLKDKMGNVANASSEVELRGAHGWLIGDEGKGVRTIIEMVAMTRFDCMIGSAAGMRQAVVQAIHHSQHRQAFGQNLVDQPLMSNVLADLALESEAALTLTMRMARSMDNQDQPHEQLLARLAVAIGKYWICKRTPQHAYEAMECIGGNGVMENCMMPRLYREAPINAIWEGSGNIQCLDVLRAIEKQPETLEAYFAEVALAQGQHSALDRSIDQVHKWFGQRLSANERQSQARRIVDQLAVTLQGALLLQHAPNAIADAFCVSRLGADWGQNYGTLPNGINRQAIIDRCFSKG